MRSKLNIIVIPVVILSLFGFYWLERDEDIPQKDRLLNQIIFGSLEQGHFNNQDLNNELSEKAHTEYLKRLDNSKRFFIQADIDKLNAFKLELDEEVQAGTNDLLKEAIALLDLRTNEAEQYYKEILAEPFDFSVDESIELDPEKRTFAQTKEQLKDDWRKYLKYEALRRYHNKLETQKKKAASSEAGTIADAKSEEEIEKEVREIIMKNYDNRFDLIRRLDYEDRRAEFLNAILAVYGPHTEYFPPQEKENFDIGMSGKLEGIGAQLSQTDGQIQVVRIVPGSPSWKGRELEVGDVIEKVGQAEEEPVDVTDMPLKDAVSMIRGKKGSEVRLTVKKPNGLITVIPIIRDVVVLEESYAKSAVIKHDTHGKKYGYIQLPSFYADFNQEGGPSSSVDVEKELEKLKEQGVDGVILDLRNNGGGSLKDAVEMSGLFIPRGPIVQVKAKEGDPIILDDKNNKVTYDGPLVVMVNKFSASASEILAAAMQDYGRAVIVGSHTTFGKGTVQTFRNLDYFVPSRLASLKPMGSLKLTIQKFYRVTGDATQFKGVEPDIVFPDLYNYLEIGEKDLDYAMPWDEIEPVGFKKWGNSPNLNKLRKNSMSRVKQDEIFALIDENSERLKAQRDKTFQSLKYSTYKSEQDKLSEESEKYKELKRLHEDLSVKSLQEKASNFELDSINAISIKTWVEQKKEDVYLYESMAILNDLID